MAGLSFLPKFFGKRSEWFNTPWVGILLATAVSLGASFMDFTDIISTTIFLYCLGMLLKLESYLWLRRKHPNLNMPYRVPMRLPLLTIMVPAAFLVLIMVFATKIVLIISGLMTIGGIGWYFLMKLIKSKRWLKFSDIDEYVVGKDHSQ